jgi:hypothetical protein
LFGDERRVKNDRGAKVPRSFLLLKNKKQSPLAGDCFNLRLVSVSATATESATESASSSAGSFAPLSIALLAINPAISVVVALSRFERKLFDVDSAFLTLKSEGADIMHLPLRAILIIHFSFRLLVNNLAIY